MMIATQIYFANILLIISNFFLQNVFWKFSTFEHGCNSCSGNCVQSNRVVLELSNEESIEVIFSENSVPWSSKEERWVQMAIETF